jgi:hypothetical protein
MKEVPLGLMLVILWTIPKEVISLCARPKAIIFDSI